VRQPWYAPRNAEERAAADKLQALMEAIRLKTEQKRNSRPHDGANEDGR